MDPELHENHGVASVFPVLLEKLKIDPDISKGPFVTTFFLSLVFSAILSLQEASSIYK